MTESIRENNPRAHSTSGLEINYSAHSGLPFLKQNNRNIIN